MERLSDGKLEPLQKNDAQNGERGTENIICLLLIS